MSRFSRKLFFLSLLMICAGACIVSAQEFSSSNYTVSNPVIFPGGYGTSTNFALTGVISQAAIGSSTGSTKDLFGGFLYYPFVSTPVISATPGSGQVSLIWTSGSASVGWSVSGYTVGTASVAGGPYTYTFIGNSLFDTVAGLSNGTPYYFVVRVLDAFGNYIATSTEVSATPVAAPSGGGGGGGASGGGGGGGGNYVSPSGTSGVNFSGRAYPGSTVTILQDAQVAATTVAGADATFTVKVANLSAGNYMFSVYSEDNDGNRSSLLSFPVGVTNGVTTNVGGIFIAPTIAVDKSEVKQGDTLTIFGQTVAQSSVTIQVNSDTPEFATTTSDKTGVYLYNFDTSDLEYGDHSTKSKSSLNGAISPYSAAVAFTVGDTNVTAAKLTPKPKVMGDANGDGKVNLIDFSVVAYWYGRSNPPKSADLNGDGKVNLVDFSILAYHWTG